ncbi:TolC family protein [Schlesneria paludicola]|uniref:TolC family protein n=1 Tax=Schlesneria paludicola TaxID=360056 RepID=UPI00029B157D|nr:TolC family protein [Schlesneria paludicola]
MDANHRIRLLAVLLIVFSQSAKSASAQRVLPTLLPEQRSISVRDPSQLTKYRMRDSVPPPTVSSTAELTPMPVSLDDVIRLSLEHTDVVRILAGATAQSSGQTIYDAAVTNTTIDQANATFDPVVSVTNTWTRLNSPNAIFDPFDPTRALIPGNRSDLFTSATTLTKQNALGGVAGFGYTSTNSQFLPGLSPLNPQTANSANINYTQPLLRGAGIGPNMAPIVIARINTELSYFVLKDSVQEMVRGTIEAYWALVAARTDVWSKQQQIDQLQQVVLRVEARVRSDIDNRANRSQAQVSLANARANLITSRANMIQREGVLRNLIGLPPSDEMRLVPHTPPADERFHPDWSQILEIASERRPDLVELKLIIEADEQQILIARNSALPQLDGVAMYRWNGLDGIMPNGATLRSGTFNDWTLGINFSVPLGLRQARSQLRQRELVIARDRVNLQQGYHNASHLLATNLRNMDQAYEQYLAFREVREAAKINLDYQLALFRTGQGILINVLQAVTDWGNAISNEANALSTYNTTLATLERQSGTILETHGVTFFEERFGAVGPLGRFAPDVCYPMTSRPSTNGDRYPVTDEPSEEKYDLKPPVNLNAKPPAVDYEGIKLPTLEESLPDVPPSPKSSPIPDSFRPKSDRDPEQRSPRETPNLDRPSDDKSSPERKASKSPQKSFRQRLATWLPR